MTASPLINGTHYTSAVPSARETCDQCCPSRTLGKRVYQAFSVAFSGAGNWPFYGVANAFGRRYSAPLGRVLGACEFGAYFAFRIRNFDEIWHKVFDAPASASGSKGGSDWKEMAKLTAIAALGIIAQFPLMVLVYYGNGEKLVYPLLSGACEASFTILSLLLSFQSSQKIGSEENSEWIQQIDRLLEELPVKYDDPAFLRTIESIFTAPAERQNWDIMSLVNQAEGLLPLDKGSWDGVLSRIAQGLGLFIALYITTVNGAVSYKGVKAWRDDQEALAIFTTIFVSMANIKLLTKLCVDSATSSYEGIRDLIKHQHRPPLAHAVAPAAWWLGRTLSNAVSWLSFGTTATAATEIPKAGRYLLAAAPVSSALLLNQDLNSIVDEALLQLLSRWDPKAKQFIKLQHCLMQIKTQPAEAIHLLSAGPA